jgi:hypothetical protein
VTPTGLPRSEGSRTCTAGFRNGSARLCRAAVVPAGKEAAVLPHLLDLRVEAVGIKVQDHSTHVGWGPTGGARRGGQGCQLRRGERRDMWGCYCRVGPTMAPRPVRLQLPLVLGHWNGLTSAVAGGAVAGPHRHAVRTLWSVSSFQCALHLLFAMRLTKTRTDFVVLCGTSGSKPVSWLSV